LIKMPLKNTNLLKYRTTKKIKEINQELFFELKFHSDRSV